MHLYLSSSRFTGQWRSHDLPLVEPSMRSSGGQKQVSADLDRGHGAHQLFFQRILGVQVIYEALPWFDCCRLGGPSCWGRR